MRSRVHQRAQMPVDTGATPRTRVGSQSRPELVDRVHEGHLIDAGRESSEYHPPERILAEKSAPGASKLT